MGFWKNLKQIIYKLDFFCTSALLRYDEESEYRTIFGGVLSLTIIVVLLVMFYNKLIGTFEKANITYSLSANSYNDPQPYTISTMPGKKFMFGVQVWNHDLNQEQRYFDILVNNVHYDSGLWNQNLTKYIPLQPCTRQHWKDYPQVLEGFDRMNIRYWRCLPLSRQYDIQGKYFSQVSKQIDVGISKCTNSSAFSEPCADPAEIDKLFQLNQNLFFTIYYINPLINPESQNYLSYYLEDMNFAIFSASVGEGCRLLMQDFTIKTDQSIIPLSDVKEEKGGMITQKCIKYRYVIDPNDPNALYSKIFISKSPKSITINRNFEKIDQILSYIGGLFGTIVIFMFLANLYNSYSFDITMGQCLLKPDDDDMKKGLKKYNFLNFLLQLLYMIIISFKSKCSWKTSKLFYQCRQEMIKQLDVSYLFKRVVILERAIGTILSQRQIRALHFMEKPTLQEAKQTRRLYKNSHDSFIYRVLKKRIQHNSQKKENRNIELEQIKDKDRRPNIIFNEDIHGKTDKNFQFFSSQFTKDRIQQPQFLAQHSQVSDSESEEDPTDQNLKQFQALKAESQKSQISKRIWNRLGSTIKDIVCNSQDSLQNLRGFKAQNSMQQFSEDYIVQSRMKQGQSKAGLRLPVLKNTKKVCVRQDSEAKEIQQLQQQGSGLYLEMNPFKKQT